MLNGTTLPPPWSGLDGVRSVMSGFPGPWCVAGGWALDLRLGRRTRDHADVDLAVLRRDQGALREHLRGWSFRKAVSGRLVEWSSGERLEPPVHEVHAESAEGRALEFLLNEHDGDEWVFRRDPAVRCPLGRFVRPSPAGLPVLCPAIVLLYKAKAPRAADEEDFRAAEPALSPAERKWLRDALARAHPGHPWLAGLSRRG